MSAIEFKVAEASDADRWDHFVRDHPDSTPYHLYGWRRIVRKTYGQPTYYLLALGSAASGRNSGQVVGVLPLVHFRHPLFANALTSMPYVDSGGILATSDESAAGLLSESASLASGMGSQAVELRQEQDCKHWLQRDQIRDPMPAWSEQTTKVRMVLDLPESPELLMKSFKSKLRSQISKPVKEGLVARDGGEELLPDFYRIFTVNMRDLGSPVHSLELMKNVLREFPESTRVFVVYKSSAPVAASIVLGFKQTLRNPWASSLRKYASLSPNMLLYLRMLEFACEKGYRRFDFGRSTPGEGTYRFKEQWGARPAPLHWYSVSLNGRVPGAGDIGRGKRELVERMWQKLPLFVTRIAGPRIRKHISL